MADTPDPTAERIERRDQPGLDQPGLVLTKVTRVYEQGYVPTYTGDIAVRARDDVTVEVIATVRSEAAYKELMSWVGRSLTPREDTP